MAEGGFGGVCEGSSEKLDNRGSCLAVNKRLIARGIMQLVLFTEERSELADRKGSSFRIGGIYRC
jgi:hypothetical protein